MGRRKNGIEYCTLPSVKLAYRVFGEGNIKIVIEGQLSSCSAEWWHIAERLSQKYKVLTYDRAGYGKSSSSKLERTPKNIALELNQLLENLEFNDNLIFIAHGLGGLYIQQYIRMFSKNVEGAIFVDPVTAYDNRFKEELSLKEFEATYMDRSKSFQILYNLSRFKFIGFLRQKFLLSPPFTYYKGFSEIATDYMLDSFLKAKHYKTAMEEYSKAHQKAHIEHLKYAEGFPNIPFHIIYHQPDIVIEELIRLGGLDKEEAERVENLWQELVKEYLFFSDKAKICTAIKSGHMAHLTETDLIYKSVENIVNLI